MYIYIKRRSIVINVQVKTLQANTRKSIFRFVVISKATMISIERIFGSNFSFIKVSN